MSWGNYLLDVFRWQALGWMEKDLSKADVAGASQVGSQSITSCNTYERLFSSYFKLSEKMQQMPQRIADLFVVTGTRISTTMGQKHLHNASLCQTTSYVCSIDKDIDREVPFYIGQRNTFSGPDNIGLLYFSQRSPGLHRRAIQGVC
ncbi:HTH_Tnp_Tc3_2 domain-containing protein [Trichonephila clavipes]|nr:HTH_Tnp_Tc3_2 domain-containing protein [Trichonephila clavipes]